MSAAETIRHLQRLVATANAERAALSDRLEAVTAARSTAEREAAVSSRRLAHTLAENAALRQRVDDAATAAAATATALAEARGVAMHMRAEQDRRAAEVAAATVSREAELAAARRELAALRDRVASAEADCAAAAADASAFGGGLVRQRYATGLATLAATLAARLLARKRAAWLTWCQQVEARAWALAAVTASRTVRAQVGEGEDDDIAARDGGDGTAPPPPPSSPTLPPHRMAFLVRMRDAVVQACNQRDAAVAAMAALREQLRQRDDAVDDARATAAAATRAAAELQEQRDELRQALDEAASQLAAWKQLLADGVTTADSGSSPAAAALGQARAAYEEARQWQAKAEAREAVCIALQREVEALRADLASLTKQHEVVAATVGRLGAALDDEVLRRLHTQAVLRRVRLVHPAAVDGAIAATPLPTPLAPPLPGIGSAASAGSSRRSRSHSFDGSAATAAAATHTSSPIVVVRRSRSSSLEPIGRGTDVAAAAAADGAAASASLAGGVVSRRDLIVELGMPPAGGMAAPPPPPTAYSASAAVARSLTLVQHRLTAAEVELAEAEAREQRLRSERTALLAEADALRAGLATAEARILGLRQSAGRDEMGLAVAQAQLEARGRAVEALRQQLADSNARMEAGEEAARAAAEAQASVATETASLRAALARATRAEQEQTSLRLRAESQLEEALARCVALQQRTEERLGRLEARLAAVTAERDTAAAECGRLRDEAAAAAAGQATSAVDATTLQRQLAEAVTAAAAAREDAEAALAALAKHRQEADAAAAALRRDAEASRAALQRALNEAVSAHAAEAASTATRHADALAAAEARHQQQLEAEAARYEAAIAAALENSRPPSQLVRADDAAGVLELAAARGELESLRGQLMRARDLLRQMEAVITAQTQSLAVAQAGVESRDKDLLRLADDLRARATAAESLQQQVAQLQRSVMEQQRPDAMAEAAAQRALRAAAEAQVDALQATVAARESKLRLVAGHLVALTRHLLQREPHLAASLGSADGRGSLPAPSAAAVRAAVAVGIKLLAKVEARAGHDRDAVSTPSHSGAARSGQTTPRLSPATISAVLEAEAQASHDVRGDARSPGDGPVGTSAPESGGGSGETAAAPEAWQAAAMSDPIDDATAAVPSPPAASASHREGTTLPRVGHHATPPRRGSGGRAPASSPRSASSHPRSIRFSDSTQGGESDSETASATAPATAPADGSRVDSGTTAAGTPPSPPSLTALADGALPASPVAAAPSDAAAAPASSVGDEESTEDGPRLVQLPVSRLEGYEGTIAQQAALIAALRDTLEAARGDVESLRTSLAASEADGKAHRDSALWLTGAMEDLRAEYARIVHQLGAQQNRAITLRRALAHVAGLWLHPLREALRGEAGGESDAGAAAPPACTVTLPLRSVMELVTTCRLGLAQTPTIATPTIASSEDAEDVRALTEAVAELHAVVYRMRGALGFTVRAPDAGNAAPADATVTAPLDDGQLRGMCELKTMLDHAERELVARQTAVEVLEAGSLSLRQFGQHVITECTRLTEMVVERGGELTGLHRRLRLLEDVLAARDMEIARLAAIHETTQAYATGAGDGQGPSTFTAADAVAQPQPEYHRHGPSRFAAPSLSSMDDEDDEPGKAANGYHGGDDDEAAAVATGPTGDAAANANGHDAAGAAAELPGAAGSTSTAFPAGSPAEPAFQPMALSPIPEVSAAAEVPGASRRWHSRVPLPESGDVDIREVLASALSPVEAAHGTPSRSARENRGGMEAAAAAAVELAPASVDGDGDGDGEQGSDGAAGRDSLTHHDELRHEASGDGAAEAVAPPSRAAVDAGDGGSVSGRSAQPSPSTGSRAHGQALLDRLLRRFEGGADAPAAAALPSPAVSTAAAVYHLPTATTAVAAGADEAAPVPPGGGEIDAASAGGGRGGDAGDGARGGTTDSANRLAARARRGVR